MAQIDGTNPREIAKRDKVSEATTQHRIRAVFGKTETHRQAELIRVLTLGLGMGQTADGDDSGEHRGSA